LHSLLSSFPKTGTPQ